MAGYNDDPVQDHVCEFMDITQSSGDNVEADLESHVKVKKQAPKTTTNKGKGKEKGKAKMHPSHSTHLDDLQPSKRKRRSEIWDHYDATFDLTIAKCKYCNKSITCATKNGTSAMLNHTRRCKKCPGNMDIKQKLLDI
uniref:BED-type domain-containing protein n=1 Tax=Opuntia streptacantha TaxID=393608 RepID=A0A7C8YZY9_OPUST